MMKFKKSNIVINFCFGFGFVFGFIFLTFTMIFLKSKFLNPHKDFKKVTKFNVEKIENKSLNNINSNKPEKTKKIQTKNSQFKNLIAGHNFGIADLALDHNDMDLFSEGDSNSSNGVFDSLPNLTGDAHVLYPSSAKEKNITGYVVVDLYIDNSGKVTKSLIRESNPKNIFDKSVIDSVRTWRFVPAKLKGLSVASWVRQTVRFDLD